MKENTDKIRYTFRNPSENQQKLWLLDALNMRLRSASILVNNDEYISIITANHRYHIKYDKIDEIRCGQLTDKWMKFRLKLLNKSPKTDEDNRLIKLLFENNNNNDDSKSFSIMIKRDNNPIICDSFDFYTENIRKFYSILKKIQNKISKLKQTYDFDDHQKLLEFLYRRYLVTRDQVESDDDQTNNDMINTNYLLLQHRFRKFLYRMNMKLDSRSIRLIMRMNGKLKFKNKSEMFDLINKFDCRPYFNFLYDKYSITNDDYMTNDELIHFFHNEQNEHISSEELEEILHDFGEISTDDNGCGRRCITRRSFYYLMESVKWNELFDYDKKFVYQDMNRPMTDYFIASSHNSFLTGNQLSSESSYEMYRKILLTGCRCVEIDIWDDVGEEGIGSTRPVVYHGYTLTTKIELQGVLEAINDEAFVKSKYPVIISVENRCKRRSNHKRIAELMKTIFKDRLYVAPIDDSVEHQFPSPEAMQGKIFIKCSKNQLLKNYLLESDFTSRIPLGFYEIYLISNDRLREHAEEIRQQNISSRERNEPIISIRNDVEENDEDYLHKMHYGLPIMRIKRQNLMNREFLSIESGDGEEDVTDAGPAAKSSTHHDQWDESFSELINYFETRKFHSIQECISDFKFHHMISRDEIQSLKIEKQAYREFTRNHMVRVYPTGWRQNSSNYWPISHWNNGAQLVALNYQRLTLPMFINNALFALNGQCGYVLKPQHLRHDYVGDSVERPPIKLRIQILSGQFWNTFYKNCSSNKNVHLKIIIRVYCGQKKYRQVTEANTNGFNPVWNETFEFKLNYNKKELTFVHFTMTNYDNFFGHYLIAFESMRKGYRFILLHDKDYNVIPLTKLFLHIDY